MVRDRDLDDVRHSARDTRIKQLAAKKKQQQTPEHLQGGEEALVVGVGPGVCSVRTPARDRVCRTKKGVVVGDRVRVDEHRVLAIFPRQTELARSDPRNPNNQRALAANVDIVVIVASVHSPPLRTGLIDRYLIAVQNGGMQPVIVVNKIDLLQDERELDELNAYQNIEAPLVLCSVEEGRGIDDLRRLLRGKTCVFTGHSGVGKSSLANALLPGLKLRTAEVDLENKGRHTTTSATLHELADNTRIIDTPGIREFGLFGVRPEELRRFFPEFDEYAILCNFSNCTHTHEPSCAVREAGLARYPTYVRIYGTL